MAALECLQAPKLDGLNPRTLRDWFLVVAVAVIEGVFEYLSSIAGDAVLLW